MMSFRLSKLQATFADNCPSCGEELSIDNPKGLWIEKSCMNCGVSEGTEIDLGALIDAAENEIDSHIF